MPTKQKKLSYEKSELERYKRWAWSEGWLKFKLHEAQILIYDLIRGLPQDSREALILCARRFGKSYLGCIMALEDALNNADKQVAIVGPTHKQTKSIVTPLIKKITEDAPAGLVIHKKGTSTWEFSNGSSIILGGFDTVLESLRGLDLYTVYLEESGLAPSDPDEYYYLLYSVIFPTLMHSRGRIIHLTTPPRILGHPLVIETMRKCKLAGTLYTFDIEKNPLLTPGEIQKEVELLGGHTSITVRRELYCEIIRDESITVVTTFDQARHVSEIEPSHTLLYTVGGDLGYTNDFSVFLLAGYDHNIGKVLVLDEKMFPPQTPSSEIVKAISEWFIHKPTIVADIQGNTRIDMSALGLPTVEPLKDKFESTITFIRNAFYQDTVLINPKCKLLIETCENGMFNRNKTDFERSSTLGHLDALMALVYLLRSVDKTNDPRPKPDPFQIFRINNETIQDRNMKKLAGIL
jgi:hypothetical protein